MRFCGPRPRTEAPTAAEVIAARKAAHDLGHAPAALAYALQFECSARQWDTTGKWLPISDRRPSIVIDGQSKWLGRMWSQVDEDLILRCTPTKTQFTSGEKVVLDLKGCPMVMEELGRPQPTPDNLLDDVAKQAGHSNKRTTSRVYDRERFEAGRRVAQARVAYRDKNAE